MLHIRHFIKFVANYTTKADVILHKERLDANILKVLENNGTSWDLYIRGLVPDYPIRKQMYEYLTERGVDVKKLQPYEIEDMTKWIEIRRIHGDKFPRLAHGITLEDKIAELKRFTSTTVKSQFLKSFNIDHSPVTHDIQITTKANSAKNFEKKNFFKLEKNDDLSPNFDVSEAKLPLSEELFNIENKFINKKNNVKLKRKYVDKLLKDTDESKLIEQSEISIPITAGASRVVDGTLIASGKHRPSSATVLETELGLVNNVLVNDLKLPENQSLNYTLNIDNKFNPQIINTIYGTNDPNEVVATSPAEIIKANTGFEPETWINMDISKLIIQQKLQKSRSSSEIFQIYNDNFIDFNHVNTVTALHRIARYAKNHEKYTLSSDTTMNKLLDHIYSCIPHMDQQSLTNTLWALTRLQIKPNWMFSLFLKLIPNANKLTVSELIISLYCISKFDSKTIPPLVVNQMDKGMYPTIRDTLVLIITQRINEFKTPIEITCIATSFARLNVRDSAVFKYITDTSLQLLSSNFLNVEHITSIIWALTKVNIINISLIEKFCFFIEKNAEKCSLRDLVNLCWSLSKINYTPNELFIYTISPMLRTFIKDMTPKDISIIAWSYSSASIIDAELFRDMSLKISSNINYLSAQDVTAILECFCQIENIDNQLFRDLLHRCHQLALGKNFTPFHLKKIMIGLSNLSITIPEKLLDTLCIILNDLPTTDIDLIPIISCMCKLGVEPSKYESLLYATENVVHKMLLEDCISMLSVLIANKEYHDKYALTGKRLVLANSYIAQCCSRSRKNYAFNPSTASSILNCINKLNLGSQELLHIIMKQLIPILKYATIEEFSLLLGALSNTSYSDRAVIRTHIHRRPLIQNIIHNKLAAYTNISNVDAASIAHACIKIGYYDDLVDKFFEEIELSGEELDVVPASQAIWAMTQAGYKPIWTRQCLLSTISKTNIDIDSSWRLLWCAISHNLDSEIILNLAESLCDQMPKDIFQAQQIALTLVKIGLPDGKFISEKNKQFYEDILSYMRTDLYENFGVNRYSRKSTTDTNKFRIRDINYDLWISECLIQLKIPHLSLHAIENVYRISASFPSHGFLLDVVSFEDTLCPKNVVQASARLRESQLISLGYLVTKINLSELYAAVADKTARVLVARSVSSFCWQARDFLSFKDQSTGQEFIPSYNKEESNEYQD